MDFGEILAKAWKIIWKHKILWLFGILAGCSATSAGGGGGGTSSIQPGNFSNAPFITSSTQQGMDNFFTTLANIPGWVWVVGVLVLIGVGILFSIVLWFLSLLLGTLGKAGVIKGTAMADAAEADASPIAFAAIFQSIKTNYWKVFLLFLGLQIAGILVGLFLFFPILMIAVCTCGLGLLLFRPIIWFIDLLVNFSTIAILEEEQTIFDAIGRAWQVITTKFGNVVVMFLILGVGQLILGFVFSLPLLVIPVPLVGILLITEFEAFVVGLILSAILFIVIVPLVVILQGGLRAYVLASWTLTYRRITGVSGMNPILLFDGEDPETGTA